MELNKPTKDINEILTERGKTHGDYSDQARCTWALKLIMHNFMRTGPVSDTPYKVWYNLSDCQRESLDMIVHKIGRIMAGDPDFRDHWDDIAGYAKLIADRCSK